MALELERGTVDIAYRELNVTDWDKLQANPKVRVRRNPSMFSEFVVMNQKPPFDKKAVREAVAYAIDYASPLTTGFRGERYYSIFPPNWDVYNDAQKIYVYNVNKAKELMAQAGYASGIWGPILQSNLAAIGDTLSKRIFTI